MAFRFEDRGLTLRLFVSMRDAMAYPTAREPARYATGWIAKNDAGRWIDGGGVLPQNWIPAPELLNRSEPPNAPLGSKLQAANAPNARHASTKRPAKAAPLQGHQMTDFKELREALDAYEKWLADGAPVVDPDDAYPDDLYLAATRPSTIRALLAELDAARRDASAKQSRIDALMLEHCPDEMTDEQVANWGDAQAAAKHNPAIDAMKEQQ